MKAFKHLLILIILSATFVGCDQNRKQATLGSSKDTSNVNRAGGGAIRDTNAINADRRDSSKKDTTSKGNVDPSGRPQKSNQKK